MWHFPTMSVFQALLCPSYVKPDKHQRVHAHVESVLASLQINDDVRDSIRHLIYIVCVNKLFITDHQLQHDYVAQDALYKKGDAIRIQMPDAFIAVKLQNKTSHRVNTQAMFETKDVVETLNMIIPTPFTQDCKNAVYIEYCIKQAGALRDGCNVSILTTMVYLLTDPTDLTSAWMKAFDRLYKLGAQKNNAEWQCHVFPAFGVPIMIAVASRDIAAGEPITITYGTDHWMRSLLTRLKSHEYIDALESISE